MSKENKKTKFVTKDILKSSLIGAFQKLSPRYMIKNPVMFVVEIGFFIALVPLEKQQRHAQKRQEAGQISAEAPGGKRSRMGRAPDGSGLKRIPAEKQTYRQQAPEEFAPHGSAQFV